MHYLVVASEGAAAVGFAAVGAVSPGVTGAALGAGVAAFGAAATVRAGASALIRLMTSLVMSTVSSNEKTVSLAVTTAVKPRSLAMREAIGLASLRNLLTNCWRCWPIGI